MVLELMCAMAGRYSSKIILPFNQLGSMSEASQTDQSTVKKFSHKFVVGPLPISIEMMIEKKEIH